jgi:hypothetical protein
MYRYTVEELMKIMGRQGWHFPNLNILRVMLETIPAFRSAIESEMAGLELNDERWPDTEYSPGHKKM